MDLKSIFTSIKYSYFSLILTLTFFVSFRVSGQIKTYSNQATSAKAFGDAINQVSYISETNYAPGLTGTNYIHKDWQKASVVILIVR